MATKNIVTLEERLADIELNIEVLTKQVEGLISILSREKDLDND